MPWTKIDGRIVTIDRVGAILEVMQWKDWRPIGVVLHNTGAPKLSQWDSQKAVQRIKNLENYYRNQQGWSAGPHAFVDDIQVCLFTPFNQRGVHSPSFNANRIGIEMVGDYESERVDSGRGLRVWKNTVALFGLLHMRLGLDPQTIKLHREDPRTTHKCPGKNIDKKAFIQAVEEWMGTGGDHPLVEEPKTEGRLGKVVGIPQSDSLNLRDESSARGKIIGRLQNGDEVRVLSEAMNNETRWLRVDTTSGQRGWVSGRYVE